MTFTVNGEEPGKDFYSLNYYDYIDEFESDDDDHHGVIDTSEIEFKSIQTDSYSDDSAEHVNTFTGSFTLMEEDESDGDEPERPNYGARMWPVHPIDIQPTKWGVDDE